MQRARPRQRRRHDAELKQRVLAECGAPGASVARVTLNHGLNANLVHKWRRLARCPAAAVMPSAPPTQFVPVALPTPSEPRADIRIELRRGATTITVTWPIAAAAEFAIWMRELLR
jgi:transposase